MPCNQYTLITSPTDLEKMPTTKERFDRAVESLKSLFSTLSIAQQSQLRLYALFKYIQIGPLQNIQTNQYQVPQPSFYQVRERAKWDAWLSIQQEGHLTNEEAMLEYIDEVVRVVEANRDRLGYDETDRIISDLTDVAEASRSVQGSPESEIGDKSVEEVKPLNRPTPLRELNERLSLLETSVKLLSARVENMEARSHASWILKVLPLDKVQVKLGTLLLLLIVLVTGLVRARRTNPVRSS